MFPRLPPKRSPGLLTRAKTENGDRRGDGSLCPIEVESVLVVVIGGYEDLGDAHLRRGAAQLLQQTASDALSTVIRMHRQIINE